MHDLIIIGLGAMGSATAYQAAKSGQRVLGIDRHTPPHDRGSSHGETRITRQALGEGATYAPLAIRSHEIWRELEAETGRELLRQNGLLIFGSGHRKSRMHGNGCFLDTTIAVARDFGLSHEVLDVASMRRRFPQYRVGPQDRGFYEPGAGMLFPEHCVGAQLDRARACGAELRLGETVQDIIEIAGGGVRVTTDAGSYEAGAAVLSAGAWVRDFLPDTLRDSFRVCRQILGWYATTGAPERHLTTVMPNFIRLPNEGEELVYGFAQLTVDSIGVKVASEQYTETCDPNAFRREVSVSEQSSLHTVASQALDLKPDCRRAVACLYTVTPDSHFVIDRHPQMRDLIVVSPCSGHGFKHSAAIGECVAHLAANRTPAIDLSAFRIERIASKR